MNKEEKEKPMQVLLRHLGCKDKNQLMSCYGINNSVADIIAGAMQAYTNQIVCDVCESTDDVQCYCAKCMDDRC